MRAISEITRSGQHVVTAAALALLMMPMAPGFARALEFERQVDAIDVWRDGVRIEQPWTGGFYTPRPLLADLDDDQDLDLLVVQDESGIIFYRNDGTAGAFDFRLVTDRLGDVRPGTWATFADIDADGDLDLFCDGNGRVAFHRNDGSAQAPDWNLTDPAFQGILNSGLGNTPSFVDLDADGDLDYVEMEQTFGTARLYRNEGTPQIPAFVFETNSFGCIDTFDPGQSAAKANDLDPGHASRPVSRRHGISIMATGDIDADDDVDILIGDLYNPNLWFFRNDPGDCFTRVTQDYLPVTTLGLNSPVLGDLDDDGDLDMLVGVSVQSATTDNLIHLENTGTPTAPVHSLVTLNLIPTLDLGMRSRVTVGDLDGDLRPELLVGSETGTLLLLSNIGTADDPAYAMGDLLRDDSQTVIHVGFASCPLLIDYENDGDLDLFVGAGDGTLFFYRNLGTAASAGFRLEVSQFAGVKADFVAAPALGDLDADGDLDLLVGEFGITRNARLFYLRNDGTTEAAIWTQVSDNTVATSVFAERVFEAQLAPALADVDADGDLDLFVGEIDGNLNFYRNVGTPQTFEFVLVDEAFAQAHIGSSSGPCFADLDGDSDLDLLVGELSGGVNLFRNVSPLSLPEPRPDPQPEAVPSRSHLLATYPNPANPSTTIRFVLARSGLVRLRVVNAQGRLVRTLLHRELMASPDPVEVCWNGRDDQGRPVTSGVYHIRLDAPGHRSAGKITLLE